MFEESVSIWASMNSWCTPAVLFVFLNLMIGTIAIASSLATHKPSEQHKPQDLQNPQHLPLARSPSVLQRLKSINFYSYRSQEASSVLAQNPALETHFTSQYTHQHEHEHEQQPSPELTRSPSVLQRFKSINLYNYLSQESTTPATPTTSSHKTREEDTHYTPPQERHEEPADEAKTEQEEEEEEEEEDEHIQDQEQTLDEVYGQLKNSHVSRTKSDTKPASGEIPKKLPKKMKKSASSKSAFSHFEERDIVEARRPATVREGNARTTEGDDEVDARADDFINKFKQQLKLQRIDSILRYKETINRKTEK